MEIPESPNSNETQDAPDASPQQPETKKRRRIPYTPTHIVLSSEQFKSDESGIFDPEADVREEDLILLDDSLPDQEEGVDELLTHDHYTDFDEDLLHDESGRITGSDNGLEMADDDLDYGGSGMAQEDEEDDFFGIPDEETGTIDHDEDLI